MAIVDAAYEKWKKDFEAECPGLFKEGVLTGPETALRRDLMRTAYMAGKKAARQPVGQEPVASVEFINGHAAELVYTGAAMPDGQHELYAAPPAQAVDLVDFKALYRAYVRLLESGMDRIRDLGGSCDPVDVMEANDVDLQAALRVIDSKAVGK